MDVVICDIGLPGANGIELLRKLRPFLPDVQFMVFTVNDDDLRVSEALKAGANGYMLKDSSPIALLEAIRELAQGGAPMSASVARRLVEYVRPHKEHGRIQLMAHHAGAQYPRPARQGPAVQGDRASGGVVHQHREGPHPQHIQEAACGQPGGSLGEVQVQLSGGQVFSHGAIGRTSAGPAKAGVAPRRRPDEHQERHGRAWGTLRSLSIGMR
ncbi:MAG: response regulator transcription factor [Flavobacteriales bacterium]|nr:response regulator transcription factor [Flavobacteriales bacterium]